MSICTVDGYRINSVKVNAAVAEKSPMPRPSHPPSHAVTVMTNIFKICMDTYTYSDTVGNIQKTRCQAVINPKHEGKGRSIHIKLTVSQKTLKWDHCQFVNVVSLVKRNHNLKLEAKKSI